MKVFLKQSTKPLKIRKKDLNLNLILSIFVEFKKYFNRHNLKSMFDRFTAMLTTMWLLGIGFPSVLFITKKGAIPKFNLLL